MTLMQFLSGLDYWIVRYQPLIAAACALGGVFYAVRPARGQWALAIEARKEAHRERLLANYRMLAKAIRMLDVQAWWKACGDYPTSDAAKDNLDFQRDLLPALSKRKELWAKLQDDLRDALTPVQFKAIENDLNGVEQRFAEADRMLRPDLETGSERWFYAAEYPDAMVEVRIQAAQRTLERLADEAVAGMVTKPA